MPQRPPSSPGPNAASTPTEGTVDAGRGRDLVVLFTRALRLLGDAGHPDAASRLAAQAWWALKDDDPAGARRVNGVMHHLAKLPTETGAAVPPHAGPTRRPGDTSLRTLSTP